MQQDRLAPPPSLEELIAERRCSLFIDFDGTLVEIAPTHDSIVVPGRLASALEALAATLSGRLALVSGRSLEDLGTHLGSVGVAQAGSHGGDAKLADGERVGRKPAMLSSYVVTELKELVAAHAGASLETKSHGAAVHYRARPELEDRIVADASAVAEQHGLTTKRGKCVIELLANSANKGDAVRTFMAEAPFTGSRPIFIGDDVTDEDGFAAVKEFAGLGIHVGGSRQTQACYRLESPQDVHRWLGLEIE